MIPTFDPIEWAAIGGVALLLAVLAVAWLIPWALEAFHTKQYAAETDRIAGVAARRRWGVGELVTAPARWLATVAMWWAGGGRRG